MISTLRLDSGSVLLPREPDYKWIASCRQVELDLSIDMSEFLMRCYSRTPVVGAGSLIVQGVVDQLDKMLGKHLDSVTTKGFVLSFDRVNADNLSNVELLRFPNTIFATRPSSFEREDKINFTFICSPEILVWHR